MAFIEPVTLKGEHATLEPLARDHEAGLAQAAADGELWRLWYTHIAPPDRMAEYVAAALEMRENLGAMPFVVRDNTTGDIVGCTRYFNVDAVEKLSCIAVEFRTHWFNHASRAAIARLGAKQDGVLRNHQLMPDGARRDTVVFSIIDGEWPAVKQHLKYKLER